LAEGEGRRTCWPTSTGEGDMTAVPWMIRPIRPNDATALGQLATLLDTMNLPRDPAMLAEIIAASTASFARLEHPAPPRTDAEACRGPYTLAAVQGEQVPGPASLLSHHGTASDPHYFLRVVEHTSHSQQLNVASRRHLLRLEREEVPWTEL